MPFYSAEYLWFEYGCLLLYVKLAHEYSCRLAVLVLDCMMTVVILKHQKFKGLRQYHKITVNYIRKLTNCSH